MVDHDDELAAAIRELTRTIDELRTELDDSHRRPPLRPPIPRPPSPGEFLRLTDEVAVPALLAALEASVRTLEAFQRGLKLVRTEREVRDQVRETAGATGTGASDRASELRKTTLSQLDTVLAELQRAVSEDALPADEEARDLLAEARELRDDVDTRLRNAGRARDLGSDRNDGRKTIEIEIDEPGADEPDDVDFPEETADPNPSVDVDAELETLKDRYSSDDADSAAVDADEPTADEGVDGSEASADGDSAVDDDADAIDDSADEGDSESGDDRQSGDDTGGN